MEANGWFRTLVILAVFALVIHLGNQLWEMASHFGDIIVVFFLAWLVAFILTPLARALQRWLGLPRSLATSLVYLALFVNVGILLVLVVPLAVDQLAQLGGRVPTYVGAAQGWLSVVQADLERRGLGVDLTSYLRSADLAARVGTVGSGLVANTIAVVGGVASALFSITVVLVLSFYLVLDGDRLLERMTQLIPASRQQEAVFLLDSIYRTFGGFLRGTLLVAFVYGVGNALVMGIAGLSYVLLASLIAGAVMVIPLFGPVLAMVLPVLLAALQGDLTKLALVVVGLLALQVVVFNVLSPKVMGESVGLHPVLVFLALLVGIKQAGLVGAIFGVPVVGVVYAMAVYFIQRRAARTPSEAAVGRASGAAARDGARSAAEANGVWPPGAAGVRSRLSNGLRSSADRVRARLARG